MTKRPLVALAAALLAVVVIAGLAYAFVARGQSPFAGCVPASEPFDESTPVRSGRSFETIEAVEALVCHAVPYPRDTGSLQGPQIVGVPADASSVAGRPARAASAMLVYANETSALLVEMSRDDLAGDDEALETLEVRGVPAMLLSAPDPLVLTWRRDGLSFLALGDGLSRDEFLSMLESIE